MRLMGWAPRSQDGHTEWACALRWPSAALPWQGDRWQRAFPASELTCWLGVAVGMRLPLRARPDGPSQDDSPLALGVTAFLLQLWEGPSPVLLWGELSLASGENGSPVCADVGLMWGTARAAWVPRLSFL